jgi:hypothetical protein
MREFLVVQRSWGVGYRVLSNSFVGMAFEDLVDVGLIGIRFLGGEAAKFGEDARGDANGDELVGRPLAMTAEARFSPKRGRAKARPYIKDLVVIGSAGR